MFVQACRAQKKLNQLRSTSFWPAKRVQACRVKLFEPTWLIFHTTTMQVCRAKYNGLNQLGSKQRLIRQACSSLPGQKLFDPTWCRMVQTTNSTLQSCKSWPGRSVFEPTRRTNLVQNIVDPASLHKLASQITIIRQQVSPCRNWLEDSSSGFLTGFRSVVTPSV